MATINNIQTKNTYIYKVGIPFMLPPALKIDNTGKLKSIRNNMLINMSFCSFTDFIFVQFNQLFKLFSEIINYTC